MLATAKKMPQRRRRTSLRASIHRAKHSSSRVGRIRHPKIGRVKSSRRRRATSVALINANYIAKARQQARQLGSAALKQSSKSSWILSMTDTTSQNNIDVIAYGLLLQWGMPAIAESFLMSKSNSIPSDLAENLYYAGY